MSILIVGGAGYIGSQTAKAVARAGLEPVVLDNLVHGHRWAAKWGTLLEGDISDRAVLDRVIVERRVTAVIHFAAYTYVGESVTDPRKYFHNNYATPDGTAIRDYIHVADLAEAHLRALGVLERGEQHALALNLGTGRGHSVREVITSVEKVSGRRVPSAEVGRRVGDPPSLVADASRAKQTLGWQPKYADLDTIVEHAFRWQKGR